MHHEIPFETVDHFVRVPVRVGPRDCRFLFDSGIGVTIVSPELADSAGAERIDETFSGQRMSGQEVTVPLVQLPPLLLGGYGIRNPVAGVIDLGSTEGESSFDGILGLDSFTDACVTVHPRTQHLSVSDAAPRGGVVVPVEVRRERRAVSMFAPLELPSGRVVTMEVDTGSAALILDDRFMPDCAVATDDPRTDERQGVDETGYDFTRRFVTIDGAIGIPGHPLTVQQAPRVMFQQIIYDGLIGADFLNQFRYSLDVRRAQLALEPLDSEPN